MLVLVLSGCRESHFTADWSHGTRTGYCVWQELAVQNEVGLVDNPLKISWLEGRPQAVGGPNHPGLSQVRNHTSLSWVCLGFEGPFPVRALLWALSSEIQVVRSRVRLAGLRTSTGPVFCSDSFCF